MLHHVRKSIFVTVFVIVVAGCSRFDYSQIPLYDEVFVPEEIPHDPVRRVPSNNPLQMPPGYKKPGFNQGPSNTTDQFMQELGQNVENNVQEQKSADLDYPKLANVPKAPNIFSQKQSHKSIQEELTEDKEKAQDVQQAILSGEQVDQKQIANIRPSQLPENEAVPWEVIEPAKETTEFVANTIQQADVEVINQEENLPQGLREVPAPITIIEAEQEPRDDIAYEESFASKLERQQLAAKPTHEFGSPKLTGNTRSSRVEQNQVGYATQQQLDEDEEQMRLERFVYVEVPKINMPKVQERKPVEVVGTRLQQPTQFLPESRYRGRRIYGKDIRGGYLGSTYYGNQY